jgi:hypothetical protein
MWEIEPDVQRVWVTHHVHIPWNRRSEFKTGNHYSIYVDVEESGLIQLNETTWWNGKRADKLTYEERREVYEFLIEWELASWRAIGPEDSELFALKKLDPEYGLE